MSADQQALVAGYEETRNSLTLPLVATGLVLPLAAELIILALAVVVTPYWLVVMPFLPFFTPVTMTVALLFRCWPIGLRLDQTGITIGSVRSHGALSRTPTVNHQARGRYSCPWSAVRSVRVVTDPASLRQIAKSPAYYTFTNRFGGKKDIAHCNIGVLTAPFMRAALVAEIEPSAVTGTQVRPARYFSNWTSGYFSRRVPPRMSSTWIVPTRHPEALDEALQRYRQ